MGIYERAQDRINLLLSDFDDTIKTFKDSGAAWKEILSLEQEPSPEAMLLCLMSLSFRRQPSDDELENLIVRSALLGKIWDDENKAEDESVPISLPPPDLQAIRKAFRMRGNVEIGPTSIFYGNPLSREKADELLQKVYNFKGDSAKS